MSFDRNRDRHLAWEELISASVSGDITMDEQASLDAHLASCAACRATADDFASQRRLVTNLRQIAPPRDLGARVRTLVELEERRMVPWWRRPPAIFAGLSGGLAVVAGALLAVVLLQEPSPDSEVGRNPSTTPQPSASIVASAPAGSPVATPEPTIAVLPTPLPSGASAPPPTPVPEPSPDATPVAPDPDGYLAVVGPLESPQLSVISGTSAAEVPIEDATGGDPTAVVGVPTDAELAPGGDWVAFMAEQGLSGISDVRVIRTDALESATDVGTVEPDPDIAVGTTLPIEDTVAGNPFVERVVWSPDGRWLASTILDPEDNRTDVWLFDATDGSAERLTNTGNAFAASFAVPAADATDGPSRLWVSLAGDAPRSHLVDLPATDAIRPLNEEELGTTTIDAFLPIVSPNGSFVIYWEGRLEDGEVGWQLGDGGRPMLSTFVEGGEQLDDLAARPLFSDVDVAADGPGFRSASIAWSPNGDAYAVWDVERDGGADSDEEPYPDPRDVYFGNALDPFGLRPDVAVDQDVLPAGTDVVDVKVGPSGRHLLITVRYPVDGDGPASEQRADLVLVERPGGDAEDIVETISPTDVDGWYGPAVFDEAAWRALLGE